MLSSVTIMNTAPRFIDMASSTREISSPRDLEERVVEFGSNIFEEIGRQQPSTFDKRYWSGRIMEWSMARPEFKVNMLRLVDVLPNLTSSAAIMRHVNEYLGPVARDIHGLLEWGITMNPHSLRAKIAAMIVRRSVMQMASQLIAGENARDALRPIRKIRDADLSFTVDLLGEFCVSEREARNYLDRYLEALDTLGSSVHSWDSAKPIIPGHPGETTPVCISVKLTALYSQCSVLNLERSVGILGERLSEILVKARAANSLVYIDAEDSASNPIIYQTFKHVFGSSQFKDFPFPGIVLQAYAKDSRPLLLSLLDFARRRGAPIAIRLVKGAYWDYETTISAQNDWPSPLFSRKESTDAQYERLTDLLLENTPHCLPAFGSHNVRSLSYACVKAESLGLTPRDFELQMLYGMADPIAKAFAAKGYLSRLYVPLGEMMAGMGYLVRRLLENTSNDSFLRHTFHGAEDRSQLLRKPQLLEEAS